jgi:hypothetical protein
LAEATLTNPCVAADEHHLTVPRHRQIEEPGQRFALGFAADQ